MEHVPDPASTASLASGAVGRPRSGGRGRGGRHSPRRWAAFLALRLLQLLASLSVLVVAAFAMVRLVPGDPVRAQMGLTAPQDVVDARREQLGLNDPLPTQFADYVGNLLGGDLGTSFLSDQPVADILAARLPNSAALAALAFCVMLIVAIPLGMLTAALTANGRRPRLDVGFRTTTGVLAVVPGFFVAVLLVYVFGVELGWFPVAGKSGPSSWVLPVIALASGLTAALCRIVRAETLRVLDSEYIRVARSKRMSNRLLYRRHVLPNTLTATLTIGGVMLIGLLTAGVLVENVFAWPGIGTTVVEATTQKDYAVVQAIVLVLGAGALLINLAVDVALALADPRSTIGERS